MLDRASALRRRPQKSNTSVGGFCFAAQSCSFGILRKMHYTFRTKLWRYKGKAAWYFLSTPESDAAVIKQNHARIRRGWGSIPVVVTIGKTTWKTSIFPDSKSGTYLLPIKAAIRKKEHLDEDALVPYTLFI